LLADLADAAGLSAAFSDALCGLRERCAGDDPGRVLVDLAVMLADGGETISDLATLRDQPGLFETVAWTATAWRVLDAVDDHALDRLRHARAVARERAWLLRAEAGQELPASIAGGRNWPGLVLDVDATVVEAHSEKEFAAAHFKGGYGFHPVLVWLDNTNEALAGLLRPGNAGANTAADHIR
jgi:Transposase DDE domain group 1